ncbi:metal-dependent hydrolase [Halovenus salina]|uniref:Metal-dependent hydrolase n=1 Tax=Halovenus salina TaxID=1510225 RepID=A0ABD5W1M0_9EURY
MPSTIVHMAFAGLVATGLLGGYFDKRSLLVVLVAVALIDFDSFIPLVTGFGHRAILHNLLVPLLGTGAVAVDVFLRDESYILDRWGAWGLRVAWVTLFCYAVTGVLLDMTDGVVNLLWPLHDQFYTLDGKIELSDQRGLVQTFIEFGGDGGPRLPRQSAAPTTSTSPQASTPVSRPSPRRTPNASSLSSEPPGNCSCLSLEHSSRRRG